MTRRLVVAVLVSATLTAFALNAHNVRSPATGSTLSASTVQTPRIFREEIHQDEIRAAQAAAARAAKEAEQHQTALRASRSAHVQWPPPPAQAQAPVYSDGTGLPGGLLCIREHESHNNYASIDKSRTYYGAYQYSKSTWANYGGFVYASDAPPATQDARALSDYNKGYRQIHQNWPTTSRTCGL